MTTNQHGKRLYAALLQLSGEETGRQIEILQAFRREAEAGNRADLLNAISAACEILRIPVDFSQRREIRRIGFDELKRLAFCNSKDLPNPINLNGRRKCWVGIGWVDEGEADGSEEAVVI